MSIWLPVSLASALLLQPAATPTPDPVAPFEGAWRLDATRSESAAHNDSAEPLVVEITRAERDLVIVTRQGPRQQRAVHGFTANAATPFSIDGAGGRAYLNGASLVTEGTRLVQGQTVATRETRTLNAQGTEMTVDVVVMVQHGYELRGGRNYGIGRDVYTREPR